MMQQFHLIQEHRRDRRAFLDDLPASAIASSRSAVCWRLRALLVESRRFQLERAHPSHNVRDSLDHFYWLLLQDVDILINRSNVSLWRTLPFIADLHLFDDTVVTRHLKLIPNS